MKIKQLAAALMAAVMALTCTITCAFAEGEKDYGKVYNYGNGKLLTFGNDSIVDGTNLNNNVAQWKEVTLPSGTTDEQGNEVTTKANRPDFLKPNSGSSSVTLQMSEINTADYNTVTVYAAYQNNTAKVDVKVGEILVATIDNVKTSDWDNAVAFNADISEKVQGNVKLTINADGTYYGNYFYVVFSKKDYGTIDTSDATATKLTVGADSIYSGKGNKGEIKNNQTDNLTFGADTIVLRYPDIDSLADYDKVALNMGADADVIVEMKVGGASIAKFEHSKQGNWDLKPKETAINSNASGKVELYITKASTYNNSGSYAGNYGTITFYKKAAEPVEPEVEYSAVTGTISNVGNMAGIAVGDPYWKLTATSENFSGKNIHIDVQNAENQTTSTTIPTETDMSGDSTYEFYLIISGATEGWKVRVGKPTATN